MAKIVLGESNNSEIIKSINGKSALAEENIFTKKNTFLVAPECDVSATSDKELVNLKTLKDNLSNLNINTSDFAKLKLANSFSEDNNFLKRVFLKNNTPSPNLGSATILSDTNNNGFISFMKSVYNTYTNVLVKMGILDGTANNTFEFKADNDVTGFKFNKNVIIENATEDSHALNRITADNRFIRRDIEDTLDNQLNFNVLPKSSVDATEDTHLVNLKTLNAKLAGGVGGSVNLSNVPKLDTDNTFTGNNVFNNPLVVGNATLDTHALNRGEADKRYGVKLLTKNLEWTVGTGGDFTDLQEAIYEASKYLPNGKNIITLKLKAGFVLDKQINIINLDLRHCILSSEDSEVAISPSLNENVFVINNSYSLIINVLFNYSGNTNNKIFFTLNNSYLKINANKGVKNAYNAIYAWESKINCGSADFSGAKKYAIRAYVNCDVLSEGAKFDGFNGDTLIQSIFSRVDLTASKFNNCIAKISILVVAYGGIIIAYEIQKTGTTSAMTNITPLQLTSSGIIYYV